MLHPRVSFEAQLQRARKDPHPFDVLDQRLAHLLRDLVFHKESNTWATDVSGNREVDTNIFRSFNALEETDNSTKCGRILGKCTRNTYEKHGHIIV